MRMMSGVCAALATVLALGGFASWAVAAPADLVIVGSRSFPADSITLHDLRSIYLGEKRMVNNTPVVAVDQSEVEAIKNEFLSRVFYSTRFEYRSELLKRRFQQGAIVPTFAANSTEALALAARTPGALTYAYRSEVAMYPEFKILLVLPAQ